MILIGPENHLPRAWRYQFSPAAYDDTLKSRQGVVHFGGGNVQKYLSPFPANSHTISSSTTGSLTFDADPKLKVGWLFKMYAGLFDYSNGMAAKVNSVTVDPTSGTTQVFFESYDSFGSGTFDAWTVVSDLLGSLNYVQNTQYSALASKDRKYVPEARFVWPVDGVNNSVVVENTDTKKSGYSETTYKGRVQVTEDQYDYNRPYVGITFTVVRKAELTTVTSTFTYGPNPADPPVINTTTVVTPVSPTSHSHTFTEDDFDPDGPGYFPGGTNADPGGPTPSTYDSTTGVLGTIVTTTYDYTFEAYYPIPGRPPEYRIVLAINTTRSWVGDGDGTIDPADFFPVLG